MQLKELNQINCPDINDAILNVVAKSCPRLQSIDLSMDRVTDDRGFERLRSVKATAAAFTDVAKSCPLLNEISLANDMFLACAESPVRNMDDFLLPIFRYCPNLTYLNVRHSTTGDDVLQTLAENCRNLRLLDCQGCPNITNAGILQVATRCLQLQDLYIGETTCTAAALTAGFPELLSLDAWWCDMDSQDVLDLIERGCPKLEKFTGSHNSSTLRPRPRLLDMTRRLERKMPPLKIMWM